MTKRVAIIGASGFTGAEVMRLLLDHPELEVVMVTANSVTGSKVADLYPQLAAYGDLEYSSRDACQAELQSCEVVFSALPHGESMAVLPGLANPCIIDLAGDFRFKDSSVYEQWYGSTHSAPEELIKWTYGLTELFREEISHSSRVANPGCYPTVAILALAPLVKENIIEPIIAVSAVSGLSGAGKGPSAVGQFCKVSEDVRAYRVASHQHTPEIETALGCLTSAEVKVSFTPHLAPLSRGIYATCFAEICRNCTQKEISDLYLDFYGQEPFVLTCKEPPGTKDVRGSNRTMIFARLDERINQIVITAAIDNLVKGAAGQAIQNANVILGLEETLGLTNNGFYP